MDRLDHGKIEMAHCRILKRESRLLGRTSEVPRLYHYTDDAAKQKILLGDRIKLRLTRVKKFLDKNEGTHVLEPFYCAAGALYEEGKIDKCFYRKMMKIGVQTLSDLIKEDVWIVCFAKNGYSRYMKERYAPRDGWVLGFRNFLEDLYVADYPDSVYFDLPTVIYSFRKIKSHYYACLKTMYDAYTATDGDEEDRLNTCQGIISSTLASLCYAYKSSYYKQEEEVRLVAYVKPDFDAWCDPETGSRLYFEESNGKRHLYIELSRDYLLYAGQSLDSE